MKRVWLAIFVTIFIYGCGDGDSRTTSEGEADRGTKEIDMVLDVGEHRDIDLGLPIDGTYTVSSRVLTTVGGYNKTLSCNPNISASEVKLTEPTNVNIGVFNDRSTVLRVIGVYAGDEVVCTETSSGERVKINITVTNSSVPNPDEIGGAPIDPSNPPDGGGGNNGGDPNNPPPLPDPNNPGGEATVDPDACNSGKYYYLEDDFNDVEGHFSNNGAIFLRSLMAGNVDSKVKIYYPQTKPPAQIVYTNMGQYSFEATSKNTTVLFELQMGQFLFGDSTKKHFYIESNGYCMRGNIPSSVMTPPDKKLVWVRQ